MRQTFDRKNLIRNSFLLCFLIFFAFFCASARAEEEWKLPAEYALTQEEEGRFESWSADQKAELLSLLMQSGQLPASADAQSAVERKDASALTAIITEWLGLPEDAVTAHSILQKERGSLFLWSVQDKAWYTQRLTAHHALGADEEILLSSDESNG